MMLLRQLLLVGPAAAAVAACSCCFCNACKRVGQQQQPFHLLKGSRSAQEQDVMSE